MKITEWAVILSIIFICFSVMFHVKQSKKIEAEQLKSKYNEIMHIATEDASTKLISPKNEYDMDDLSEGVQNYIQKNRLNLDESVNRFYKTIYLNLGIEDDKTAQQSFERYIPFCLVIDHDGFYVYTREEIFDKSSNKNIIKLIWLPKKFYTYYDEKLKLTVQFTLKDDVYIYDHNIGIYKEGKRKDFEMQYNTNIFEEENFNIIKMRYIVECTRKSLEYYTIRNNYIVKHYGLGEYTFQIPYINQNDWNNTIKSEGFIAFLQGIPVSSTEYYNTFGFGGTNIETKKYYIGSESGSKKTYHLKNCKEKSSFGLDYIFNTRLEAVKQRFYPCTICKP